MPSSIFIVDSSPAVRRMVEQISTPEGFEVVGFQDGPAALEAARRISPALIIADYNLDNMTFSGFCKEINKLDNLTETYLISLINPADRPDENHLRTLGVKAFLNKPFQSDDLLDVIKSLHQKQHEASNGKGLKRRLWPPTSTTTDSDKDDEVMDHFDASDEQEDQAMDQHRDSPNPAPAARASTAGPEDAMKGLFDQLLQSMAQRTEKKLTDLLPQAIEEKLASHVRPIVQRELQTQLGDILSHERLAEIIQPLLSQELPALLRKEITACEPIIRQTVSDLAGASIRESLDQLVREQAEAGVRKHLPDVVRGHLGAIDLVVKDEIQQATLKQAPLLADDIVRATAEQTVEQAVQRIIPELAEQHIKAELKRLIGAVEAPGPSKS
ncbi:MAG: response regulator [Nitrospira sp.]|nr:MAG: response regulator [Nitrospira sp.]